MEKKKQFKNLPATTKEDMDTYAVDRLKDSIVTSEQQLEELVADLLKNEAYQSALSVKKDIEGGQRDVKKVLREKIKYALFLLELKGKI